MALIHAPYVATCTMAHLTAPAIDLQSILYIHSSPYNTHAWHNALSLAKLSLKFPNLVHDITYSSPIGNPPPLTHTFLPPNLASANLHPELIDLEIASEVLASRISGPFSPSDAEKIFGSFFRSSPVGPIEKIQGDNVWRIIHHLLKRDVEGHSTNEWLDSDDFPTTYFTASWVAQFVSHLNLTVTLACTLLPGIMP